MGKPRGIRCARKMRNRRRDQRWADLGYKKANLGTALKANPFGGASHAKGIVLEKIGVEAKQPNSAIRKCVRVQVCCHYHAVVKLIRLAHQKRQEDHRLRSQWRLLELHRGERRGPHRRFRSFRPRRRWYSRCPIQGRQSRQRLPLGPVHRQEGATTIINSFSCAKHVKSSIFLIFDTFREKNHAGRKCGKFEKSRQQVRNLPCARENLSSWWDPLCLAQKGPSSTQSEARDGASYYQRSYSKCDCPIEGSLWTVRRSRPPKPQPNQVKLQSQNSVRNWGWSCSASCRER